MRLREPTRSPTSPEVDATIEQFRAHVSQSEKVAERVSAWSIGQHIRHCTLAMIVICRDLDRCSAEPPRQRWSFLRLLVFTTGIIPRGRGKAPGRVLPDEQLSPDQLSSSLDEARKAVAEALQLPDWKWFQHAVFGILKRQQAIRLIEIHNRHHLKIIRDILA